MNDCIDRNAIKHLMLDKDLSQRKLADITGFDRNTISNFLSGANPSYTLMQAIKTALDMTDEQAGVIFFANKLA